VSDKEPPRVTVAELIGPKFRLDPADPILIVATIFEELQKKALTRLGAVVTDAAEQIATTTVLTENSARARSETIVNEAGRWAGEQIRTAGADAGKLAADVVREFLDRTERAERRATIAAWISSSAAVAAVAAIAAFVVLR
jgi:glycine/D-amino acid oxidase-like deaminating enzyme